MEWENFLKELNSLLTKNNLTIDAEDQGSRLYIRKIDPDDPKELTINWHNDQVCSISNKL